MNLMGKGKAFQGIDEAKVEYPTPERFRVALVDDVHFKTHRFDQLDPKDLLEACGVTIGSMDEFCISQVPSNRGKFLTSDTGWSFIYTYRIHGKNRRMVRFRTKHSDGGKCVSCIGPYIYRKKSL